MSLALSQSHELMALLAPLTEPAAAGGLSIASLGTGTILLLFILSLGGLANPETARRGNLFGMVGTGLQFEPAVEALGQRQPGAGVGLRAERAVEVVEALAPDADDQTIVTLVNFGCHPETLADENLLLDSLLERLDEALADDGRLL